jgi:hypothetical protein
MARESKVEPTPTVVILWERPNGTSIGVPSSIYTREFSQKKIKKNNIKNTKAKKFGFTLGGKKTHFKGNSGI